MSKEATLPFSSLSLAPSHFQTRGRVFRNGRRMIQEKSKGRKPPIWDIRIIPNYLKLYILIIFIAIL